VKSFVVVRDNRNRKTVYVREAAPGADSAALHEALRHYPDPNRYSCDVFMASSWESLTVGHPKLSDGRPGMGP